MREIVNAIFYQNRTGCQWVYLPHDPPPKSATYYYFALWCDDGTDAIHDLLRCQAREKAGRGEDPTAVVLDAQSIRVANYVPAARSVTMRASGYRAGSGAWHLPRRRGRPASGQVHLASGGRRGSSR